MQEELRSCSNEKHKIYSKHPKNGVPSDLFKKPNSNDYYKNCLDCRNYKKDNSLKNKERKNSIKNNPDYLCCMGQYHNSKSEYPKDKIPVELFRKEPDNDQSELLSTCKDCRDTNRKTTTEKKEAYNKALENKSQFLYCRNDSHRVNGSQYPADTVPIELFRKYPDNDNELFTSCKDCRDSEKNKDKQKKELRKKAIEEESLFLCCQGVHACDWSIYPKNKVPIELFRKEPDNEQSELFTNCKDCRDYKDKADQKKQEIKQIAHQKGINEGADFLYCTGKHKSSGSKHPVDKVPIELFREDVKNEQSKLFTICKDCRDHETNKKRNNENINVQSKINKKETYQKALVDGSNFLYCQHKRHNTSGSKYPVNQVPIELFRKIPDDEKSELLTSCKDCRDSQSIYTEKLDTKNKQIAIETNRFYCVSCQKFYHLTEQALNEDGTHSIHCLICKERAKNARNNKRKFVMELKMEYVEQYQACCYLCKSLYIKNETNNSAIELTTYLINDERYVEYNDQEYTVNDFLSNFRELLELRILEFDHLTEEEQRKRGLLQPDDEYEEKKHKVGGKFLIRKEAQKCQLLCARCHLTETIRREKKSGHGKSYFVREKIAYVNDIKIKGCEICQYSNPELLRFFEFDHHSPLEKIDKISNMVHLDKYTFEDLLNEITKCRIICRHCHLIHTKNQNDEGVLLNIEKKRSKK